MKISLCMIVKDEAEVLARCLDSVKDCVDEIVIADTGSTDNTRQIALNYTDKLLTFPWREDFAAARNFSFSHAEGDYLLWLDADDYLFPDSAARFSDLRGMLAADRPDIVMCRYDIAFDKNGPTSSFYRERLLRREAHFTWQGRVHECIAPHGKIVYSDIRIAHLGSGKDRGARNLHIYQKWAQEEPLGGRDLFYYGRELYYNKLYTEAIAVLTEMLDGDGWYVNKIEACKILSFCYAERGEREKALLALFRSLSYGEPRASVLCEIAKSFQGGNRLREAVFWYEAALTCRDHSAEGDFEEPQARDLVPLLELICCYYALGDTEKALFYHGKTEELFPKHPSVTFNRDFFKSKGFLLDNRSPQ